jgi:hypothetical protein
MKRRPLMRIGQEFTHPGTGHVHRVTDVGTRTFLTINTTCGAVDSYDSKTRETDTRIVTGDEWKTWLSGPPYATAEHVWDEYAMQALADVEGIEWSEDLTMKTLTASLGCHDEKGEAMWPDWMRNNMVTITDETGERRSLTLPQLLADLAVQDIACLPATVMQRLVRDWKP